MATSTAAKILLDGDLVLPNPELPGNAFQVLFGLPGLVAGGQAILLSRLHPLGPCSMEVKLNAAPTFELQLQKSPLYSFHKIYSGSFLSEEINQLSLTVSGPQSVEVSDVVLMYEVEVASKSEVDLALSSPALAFVFRPGGVAGRNVYTSFASLVNAMSQVEGRKILEFDDSVESPCVIGKRPDGGAWPMKDVLWAGFAPRTGVDTFRAEVEIEEGATFTDLRMFGGSITVRNQATSTSPVSDFGPGQNHVHIGLNGGTVELVNTGAAPMFDLGGNDATFVIQNCLFGVRSTTELVAHDGGACRLQFLGLSLAGENLVKSAAGATVRATVVSSATAVAARQTSTTEASVLFQYTPVARIQRQVLPENGPAAVVHVPIGIPNAVVQCDGSLAFSQTLPKIIGGFLIPQSGGKPGYTGGQEIVVAEVKGGSNLSVKPSAGDTIDGDSVAVPIAAHGSRTFISDGISNWITISVTP